MTSIQDTAICEEPGLFRQAQTGARKTETGQEDVLKLMTTQLRNQDPFKPMENGEFMGRLAQFGTVSGIGDVRTELQNLSGSLVSNQSLQVAALLGHDVLIPGCHGVLDIGGSIDGAVELPNAVTNLAIGKSRPADSGIRRRVP